MKIKLVGYFRKILIDYTINVDLYLANEWDFRYPTELGFLGKTRRKFGEDLRKTRSSDLGGNYVV
ncbi:hypothetical protein HanXRQr2_Chr05g0224301 [Helianthus annuus]|nr:hypothetical protein HanXRQr2_Chr05g0224301 [Helianthus annuus]